MEVPKLSQITLAQSSQVIIKVSASGEYWENYASSPSPQAFFLEFFLMQWAQRRLGRKTGAPEYPENRNFKKGSCS
jgi:hypothetical protein